MKLKILEPDDKLKGFIELSDLDDEEFHAFLSEIRIAMELFERFEIAVKKKKEFMRAIDEIEKNGC